MRDTLIKILHILFRSNIYTISEDELRALFKKIYKMIRAHVEI
jgi:hypothetical protein